MEKRKVIHLEEANTLSNFLTKEERENIVSLKITGLIDHRDFKMFLMRCVMLVANMMNMTILYQTMS